MDLVAEDQPAESPRPNYLSDFIFGGIDGTITTFALVAGIQGAGLSPGIIIVLGIANIFADGFSMAASNYSGAKTVLDNAKRYHAVTRRRIEEQPSAARRFLKQLLLSKGIPENKVGSFEDVLTADDETWLDFMVTEQYGNSDAQKVPIHAAIVTFSAFLVCGIVPIIPFVLMNGNAFEFSAAATLVTFFIIGAFKSRWSVAKWYRSGTETLLIGALAASMAYVIGYLVGHL